MIWSHSKLSGVLLNFTDIIIMIWSLIIDIDHHHHPDMIIDHWYWSSSSSWYDHWSLILIIPPLISFTCFINLITPRSLHPTHYWPLLQTLSSSSSFHKYGRLGHHYQTNHCNHHAWLLSNVVIMIIMMKTMILRRQTRPTLPFVSWTSSSS